MMAPHCRSWAAPVRSSLGKRVPQTRNAQLAVNRVHQRIEPDEPSKSRPTSSPSDVEQDPPRRRSRVAPISWSEDDLKMAGLIRFSAVAVMRTPNY
jgi:hypothetical protein